MQIDKSILHYLLSLTEGKGVSLDEITALAATLKDREEVLPYLLLKRRSLNECPRTLAAIKDVSTDYRAKAVTPRQHGLTEMAEIRDAANDTTEALREVIKQELSNQGIIADAERCITTLVGLEAPRGFDAHWRVRKS